MYFALHRASSLHDRFVTRQVTTSYTNRCAFLLLYLAYYDRVLVMDAGTVAEFDTPLNLFDKKDSIFRSLCDKASLNREDILRIRGELPRVKHPS